MTPCPDADELVRAATVQADPEPGAIANAETLAASAVSDTLAADAGTDATQASEAGVPVAGGLELWPGDRIDRYVIESRLGAGGMGVVYAAHDPELDRRVAVKLLHPRALGSGAGGDARIRLMREAQAVAKVSHPNVIAVHDIGTWQPANADGPGQVFVAMELVDGWNLRQWQAETPRGWREVLQAFLAAGRGLAAAHTAGLIHRDIKPDNVLIGRDGAVRVTDFGMARVAPGVTSTPTSPPPTPTPTPTAPTSITSSSTGGTALSTDLTRTGALLGTPAYMAPEQLAGAGDDVDARSDQFSFCVALWEGVYGRRPFAGGDLDELTRAVRAGALRPPPAETRVPAWIRRALTRGLAPDPAARWPAMTALLAALSPERRRTRHRLIATIAAVVLGGVGVALIASRTGAAPSPCRGAERQLDGVWDPARKRAVAAAFAASGHPTADAIQSRLSSVLDRYTSGWVAMRTEACAATRIRGEQTAQIMDLRIRCLDERLAGVRRVVELAAAPDPDVMTQLLPTAERLAPVTQCANSAGLLTPYEVPLDPAKVEPVARVREEVERVYVNLGVGRYDEVSAALADIDARSKAIGWPALEAEVLQLLAAARAAVFDAAGEERYLRAAMAQAEIGHHDIIRGAAAITLVSALAAQGRLADADQWADYARAVVARLGDEPVTLSGLFETIGMLRLKQGRPGDAEQLLRQSLALRERASGPSSLEVASTKTVLANVLLLDGKPDAAAALQAEATAVWTAVYGPDSLPAVLELEGRATAAIQAGDYAAAIDADRQALVVHQRLVGPHDPALASELSSLGFAFELAGRRDEALASHRQAVSLLEGGAGTPLLADELDDIGAIALDLGRNDDAIAAYDRATQVAEDLGAPAEATLAMSRAGLGRARVAAGQAAIAIEPLEQALAWRTKQPDIPPNQLAGNRFSLAQALWLGGGDRARSRQLATDALAGFHQAEAAFRDQPGAMVQAHDRMVRYIAEVEAWQREHR